MHLCRIAYADCQLCSTLAGGMRIQSLLVALQAEVQSKAALIEKQKQNVSTAQRINKALNPNKLKIEELLSQINQKLARLDELNKAHPELQQVFQQYDGFVHCLCQQKLHAVVSVVIKMLCGLRYCVKSTQWTDEISSPTEIRNCAC